MIPASEDCPGSCGCPRPRSNPSVARSTPLTAADSDRLCRNPFGVRGSRFLGSRQGWRNTCRGEGIVDSTGAENDSGTMQPGGD